MALGCIFRASEIRGDERSFTALCSSDLCMVKRHKGQMWPCVAGSLPFKLLPEHPPAKHFLQARPEKQVRLR